MITLGIESSCDDTAAAILTDDACTRANIISGQDPIHQRFGGIVPELASRSHIECITAIVDEALKEAGISFRDIDLIAATQGPGLIGSLLVGFTYAKSLAYTLAKPYVGVDHMTGHLLSAFLEPQQPAFPYIALIVSGGTTALYRADGFLDFTLLGRTRDDAAGEAFDKVARLLDLGYPGGPVISEQSRSGERSHLNLPRAWLDENSLDFSFSGLKTAVMNHVNKCTMHSRPIEIQNICASFQEAVVEVLVEKTIAAAQHSNIKTIVLGGGVAANDHLRNRISVRCKEETINLFLPAKKNCTDNAAMIAFSGLKRFEAGFIGSHNDDVFSRSYLGQ